MQRILCVYLQYFTCLLSIVINENLMRSNIIIVLNYRGDPYEPHKPPEKVTISWGGSRYLKVVDPFVWHQSW